ncbi:MAG: M23 family metallopeptidase [Leptospiraceae bacterium]|nr:M23 family metallopeptidase [Leptospiraceae bacterium]
MALLQNTHSSIFSLIIFLFLQIRMLVAQEVPYEAIRKEVAWPLSFYSPISGTFCEYRNYNMHMGADFKSYGLNGHPILATYDGYIEHISQSRKGYGVSLNIHSPSIGIKTKYAHLHSFLGSDGRVELLRQSILLLLGKDEFYFNLPSNAFPVQKAEWIGLTGESGTGVPHLHLEFRDDKGFINPLYFSAYQHKDTSYPEILKLIWEDTARSSALEIIPIKEKEGRYKLKEPLLARGKIRIKLGGYDFIRSRNKNNVYAFGLKQEGYGNEDLSLYRNQFLFVPYSQSSNRQAFYDTNRSSLSPPVYFYNIYDLEQDFSIDTSRMQLGDKKNYIAYLEDASGNRSELTIPLEIGEIIEPAITEKPPVKTGSIYMTQDKQLQLDFRKNETYGNGFPILSKTTWEEQNIKIPNGLTPVSDPYKISVQNFNWKGEVEGLIRTNNKPTVKETLYFYDSSIQRFSSVWSKRTSEGFQFKTAKLGILGVLADDSPPYVSYSFAFSKNIKLPKASNPRIMERTYYLGDSGSGYTTNPEVYLDGEKYPFTYDSDRKAIHISLAKKAFEKKKFLLLEIKPRDWAGNVGKTFTEILKAED